MSLQVFTESYIRTALWAETDGEEPLDANHSAEDIAPETVARMRSDAESFYTAHAGVFGDHNARKAGHDFWLTRNHHGAGFWDGDWADMGDVLTKASHGYRECELYVGDDGLIYAL
jgi:hypothetical protein